jgi:hypothetical protein
MRHSKISSVTILLVGLFATSPLNADELLTIPTEVTDAIRQAREALNQDADQEFPMEFLAPKKAQVSKFLKDLAQQQMVAAHLENQLSEALDELRQAQEANPSLPRRWKALIACTRTSLMYRMTVRRDYNVALAELRRTVATGEASPTDRGWALTRSEKLENSVNRLLCEARAAFEDVDSAYADLPWALEIARRESLACQRRLGLRVTPLPPE